MSDISVTTSTTRSTLVGRLRRRGPRLLDALILVLVVAAAFKWWPRDESSARSNDEAPPPVLRLGDAFSAGDAKPATKNIFLLLLSTCGACQSNVPFYQELTTLVTARSDIQFTVLGVEPIDEFKKWLTQSGIRPHSVVRLGAPNQKGFYFFPTLLITNSEGLITDMVQQAVPQGLHQRLLERIAGGSGKPVNIDFVSRELAQLDFEELKNRSEYQVIDIRERGRSGEGIGFIKIPWRELPVRARIELSRDRPIGIDCTHLPIVECRAAGATLTELGFSDVLSITR